MQLCNWPKFSADLFSFPLKKLCKFEMWMATVVEWKGCRFYSQCSEGFSMPSLHVHLVPALGFCKKFYHSPKTFNTHQHFRLIGNTECVFVSMWHWCFALEEAPTLTLKQLGHGWMDRWMFNRCWKKVCTLALKIKKGMRRKGLQNNDKY